MKISSSVSAATGEYLVLGEMLKRGYEAYLAHGETQKGWDLVILQKSILLRVQVKTIDWPRILAVNGKLTDGFDFMVVVLLDRSNSRSRFFIFPVNILPTFISSENPSRGDGNRTLTMSVKSIDGHLAPFEDAWDLLKNKQSSHDVASELHG